MGQKKRVVITKQIGCGRPQKTYSIILLDTKKIHKKILQQFKRRQKVLDKLQEQLRVFYEKDLPEYNKLYMSICGTILSEERIILEKYELLRKRYDKIQTLAKDRGISDVALLQQLRQKATMNHDIWYILEEEITVWEEKQRKLEEERQRRLQETRRKIFEQYREYQKNKKRFEKFSGYSRKRRTMDDMLDFFFRNMEFEGYEFDDESDSEEGFDFRSDFYSGVYATDASGDSSDKKNLKQVYRELCQKYHPDKVERYDDEAKRIWLEIVDAYHHGDLEKLTAIHSRMNIGSDLNLLSCSELRLLINDLESTIFNTRTDVRKVKKQVAWEFFKRTPESQKQSMQYEFDDIRMRSENAKNELQMLERFFDELLNKTPESSQKPKKNARKQQKILFEGDFIEDFLFKDFDSRE